MLNSEVVILGSLARLNNKYCVRNVKHNVEKKQRLVHYLKD